MDKQQKTSGKRKLRSEYAISYNHLANYNSQVTSLKVNTNTQFIFVKDQQLTQRWYFFYQHSSIINLKRVDTRDKREYHVRNRLK